MRKPVTAETAPATKKRAEAGHGTCAPLYPLQTEGMDASGCTLDGNGSPRLGLVQGPWL